MKSLKESGNSLFKAGKYQEACDIYSEALAVDPHNVYTNAKLYCNRATVGSKVCIRDVKWRIIKPNDNLP